MAEWTYLHPKTKEPIRIVAGDKVPEPLVRAWFKQNMPAPRSSPLQQTPLLSMPTPFEFSDGSVWQSPKGPGGPGVIANTLSKLMSDPVWNSQIGPVTPDVAQKETYKGMIEGGKLAATARLPAAAVSTLMRRLLSQGAISAGGEALAGGNLNQIAEHGVQGAAGQGLMEGIFGVARPIAAHFLGKKVLAGHALDTKRVETQNAQNAEGMLRNAEGKALVGQMDKKNIADEGAGLLAEHGKKVQAIEGENAARSSARDAHVYGQKVSHRANVAEWEAQKALTEAKYKADMLAHAEQGAQQVMEEIKSKVPWLRELTSDGRGVMDLVVGKGQRLLSEGYDPAMLAALETAKGVRVAIPVADAKRLGVKVMKPSARELAPGSTRDPLQGVLPGQENEVVQVDAANLIERLTRMGKNRDYELYNRNVNLLNEMELGIDPAARAQYKTGSGAIEGWDKNNLLTFDEVTKQRVLNPDALIAGTQNVANMKPFERREMGNALESPFITPFEGSPPVPTIPARPVAPLPPPKVEPTPLPAEPELPQVPDRGSPLNPKPRDIPEEAPLPESPNFGEIKLPGTQYARGSALGGLFGLLGALGGGHGGGALGAGGGLAGGGMFGYGLGRMLPDKLKTTVPIRGYEELLRDVLMATGTLARDMGETPSGPNVDISPQDLAEIRAAQFARQTAQDNPALQLGLNPE